MPQTAYQSRSNYDIGYTRYKLLSTDEPSGSPISSLIKKNTLIQFYYLGCVLPYGLKPGPRPCPSGFPHAHTAARWRCALSDVRTPRRGRRCGNHCSWRAQPLALVHGVANVHLPRHVAVALGQVQRARWVVVRAPRDRAACRSKSATTPSTSARGLRRTRPPRVLHQQRLERGHGQPRTRAPAGRRAWCLRWSAGEVPPFTRH